MPARKGQRVVGRPEAAPASRICPMRDLSAALKRAATDGKTYTLSKELKGHWVVLGWFPKAFTGG